LLWEIDQEQSIGISYDPNDLIYSPINFFSEDELIYILEEYQKRLLNIKCCKDCDLNSIDRCINFKQSSWLENHKNLCLD